MRVTPVTGSTLCTGGALIEIGSDLNDDSTLAQSEVTSAQYLCAARGAALNCAAHRVWDGGSCVEGQKVFVTAGLYSGNLGGAAGADRICMQHAAAAGLSGTFKAWLGVDAANDPDTAFAKYTAGRYSLIGATTIANNWADLADGAPTGALNRNEVGVVVTGNAWTQTTAAGAYVAGSGCSGFTSTTGTAQVGAIGDYSTDPPTWLNSSTAQSCAATNLSLYCIEQASTSP